MELLVNVLLAVQPVRLATTKIPINVAHAPLPTTSTKELVLPLAHQASLAHRSTESVLKLAQLAPTLIRPPQSIEIVSSVSAIVLLVLDPTTTNVNHANQETL